ncbi:SRPBCC family protein [uncultured Prevotella sp.]|uniref:SRPBCC family protein n=1 Tax=uncultured Prevotella sp. TaxID=159272 RepID=UPI00262D2884|nr:SRPBCC family protein [uncultured Prevotella sp.]
MSKFESGIKHIPHPQTAVYNALSDLSNLDKVKDKLPEDKIKDLSFDSDSLTIGAPMGSVSMRIIEREEPKCIKFATEKSPIAANLWIQIVPEGEDACKMKLTIKADINPFIKGMVAKPLQEGLEKIADVLAMIPYNNI